MTHYAVLIGNSQFPKADLSSLTSPPKDVEAFAAELAVEGRAFDQVIPLINQPRYEIEKILEPIFDADGAGKDDLILLYYSGHGLPNNKNNDLYLATFDTEKERLKSTALSFETLYRWIKDSHCKRIVILLDCCYSGIAGDVFAKGDLLDARFNALQNKVTSTCLMTAAWNDQVALDQADGGLSLFTKHLINGWRGDADRDGNITFDSLFDYVNQKVIEEKANQVPKKFVKNANGQLILAKSGRDSRKERAKKITDYLYDLAKDERISHDIVTESRGILAKPLQALTQAEAAKDELLTQVFSSHQSAEFMLQWGKLDAAVHETAKQLAAQHIAEEAQRLATQQAELVQQAEAKRILAEQQRQQAEQEAAAAKRTAQQEKEKQAAVAKQLAEAKHREAEAAKKREAEAKQAAEETRRKAEEAAKQAEERQRAEQAEREAQDKKAVQQTIKTQPTPIEPKPNWIKRPLLLAGGGLLALGGAIAFFTLTGSSGSGVNAGDPPHAVAVTPPPPATPAPVISKENTNSLGMTMVTVDAGSFTMGCKSGRDADCSDDEKLAHLVNVPAFAMSQTEVTVSQYMACVKASACSEPEWREAGNSYNIQTGTNDLYKKLGDALTGDDYPIVGVSWDNATQYAKWVSQQEGKPYRLPTEAEWEYACRAGVDSAYCGGSKVDAVAWYGSNSGSKTHSVAKKDANAFGLYDMSGNVWEWVQDNYHDSYKKAPIDGSAWEGTRADARVLRGGSWVSGPQDVRAAFRIRSVASDRVDVVGFRLARTLP